MREKETIYDLLKRYWGYESFRPIQEEVIRSALSGRDTLVLLPTGGGKSLTYQVPGLALEGTCLVVTPLIALMKDQVSDLKARGIRAEAIYTGIELDQIESILNKTIYRGMDFLYVSPERLVSEHFRTRLRQMKVSLIAVDEAHCISQWGYDFRPSYLRIAEIRDYFPETAILALTATATREVVKDIQEKLAFRAPHVLAGSFQRKNLSYVVRSGEDRYGELLHILTRIQGAAIVYTRKRKNTEELADRLIRDGIPAGFYHAGLSPLERSLRQDTWKSGQIPVMVATNAFGMGIDKADVRVVVHYDIPDSPEAYFQEAGRAGRDGRRAYAVLLYSAATLTALKERVERGFPDKKEVVRVYEALSNYFEVAEGTGEGRLFEFDAHRFAGAFQLDIGKMQASLGILEVAGYIEVEKSIRARSRVMIRVVRDRLYDYDFGNPLLDRLLIVLMRYYAGIFVQDVYVDEEFVAAELGVDEESLYQGFLQLSRLQVIHYVPGNDLPHIRYLMPRFPLSYITLSKEAYHNRKLSFSRKINAMTGYIETCEGCRQRYLAGYFGQPAESACGICDHCLSRKRATKSEKVQVRKALLEALGRGALPLRELVDSVEGEPDLVLEQFRLLLDEGEIVYISHETVALPDH